MTILKWIIKERREKKKEKVARSGKCVPRSLCRWITTIHLVGWQVTKSHCESVVQLVTMKSRRKGRGDVITSSTRVQLLSDVSEYLTGFPFENPASVYNIVSGVIYQPLTFVFFSGCHTSYYHRHSFFNPIPRLRLTFVPVFRSRVKHIKIQRPLVSLIYNT